jgi:hypothetical protein
MAASQQGSRFVFAPQEFRGNPKFVVTIPVTAPTSDPQRPLAPQPR